MTTLQLAGLVIGIAFMAFAMLLIVWGACQVSGNSDDATERIAAQMKEGQE